MASRPCDDRDNLDMITRRLCYLMSVNNVIIRLILSGQLDPLLSTLAQSVYYLLETASMVWRQEDSIFVDIMSFVDLLIYLVFLAVDQV